MKAGYLYVIAIDQPQTVPVGAPMVTDFCDADLTEITTFQHGPPHEAFDQLRANAPVAWQHEKESKRLKKTMFGDKQPPSSPGFWVVTSHELVTEVSKNPALFSSALGGSQMFTADEDSLMALRLMLLNTDPPEQSRLRKIVTPAFTPRAINTMRESIETNARDLAESIAGAGTVDLVPTVSAELPARMLSDVLGMPTEDRHLIVKWSDALIGFEDAELHGDPADTTATFIELTEYGKAIAADRRITPRDDMISRIANAEVDGERLTDDEFAMFWLLLIVAGNETTRNSLSGAVIALQEQGRWQELAATPERIPTATDELIRHVSPVMQFRRTATADVELGGQSIRAGDKVVVWYGAANRDPAVFDDPHRLNLDRDPNPHLAFGIGPHFCLGSRLARLQFGVMLGELLKHYPRLRIDGEVRRTWSTFIAGVAHLPVALEG
jgi:cytochrome P450